MSLISQIEKANTLGRTNLNAKGVTTDGTETTYEIMSKIADVSGGGSLLNHTVTFTVDGEPYEIVSVKDGNSVNAPATEPTSESGIFTGWDITFPYTPTSDTKITALFQTVRTEIELNNAGDVWFNDVKKQSDGWAIVGYALKDTAPYFCIVSETEDGCKVGSWLPTSFTYNGQTYYYLVLNFTSVSNYGKCAEVITYNTDKSVMAKDLLDYYYIVE